MSSTTNNRALIASIPNNIARFFYSESLAPNTPSILLVLDDRNYAVWNNLQRHAGKSIVIRPLRYLASFMDIDSKWVQFPERASECKLVLMSMEQYRGDFVRMGLAGRVRV